MGVGGSCGGTEGVFSPPWKAASGDTLGAHRIARLPPSPPQARFDKPPLVYWAMAAAIKLFGEAEWVVRLPSAAAAAALMAAVMATVWRFGLADTGAAHSAAPSPASVATAVPEPPLAAVRPLGAPDASTPAAAAWARCGEAAVAGAAASLNLLSVVWGSAGLSDMLLAATVGGSLLAFFWGYATNGAVSVSDAGSGASAGEGVVPGGRAYSLAAVLAGLSLLAKGPVGPLLILLTAGSFMLATGELLPMLRHELPLLRGSAIVSAIAAPVRAVGAGLPSLPLAGPLLSRSLPRGVTRAGRAGTLPCFTCPPPDFGILPFWS